MPTGRPAGRPARWLLREPAPDGAARLFCLPYSGAGASALRRWPLRVGRYQVCPVRLPGRETRVGEQPYRDMDVFAAEAADALAGYLDRPFALFGHCTGALLAYALAVRLVQRGTPPARLFVSSALPPHWPAEQRYRPPRPGEHGFYHPSMTDAELVGEVQRVGAAVGGGEVPAELLPLAVRALRADVELSFGYQLPGPGPLGCPITAIGWTADPDVGPEQMLEWRAYGEVTHRVVTGDKLAFLAAPPGLLELLAEDEAAATPGPAVDPARR